MQSLLKPNPQRYPLLHYSSSFAHRQIYLTFCTFLKVLDLHRPMFYWDLPLLELNNRKQPENQVQCNVHLPILALSYAPKHEKPQDANPSSIVALLFSAKQRERYLHLNRQETFPILIRCKIRIRILQFRVRFLSRLLYILT